jgi:ribosomal protein L37AE/L43A
MKSLKGNCQRCKNFDKYLRKVNGKWLCRRCRDEQKKFPKPKIPTQEALNPLKSFKKKLGDLKREVKKKRKRR